MSRYYVEISRESKDGYYEFSHSLPISEEEMPYSLKRGVNSNGWWVLGYNDYIGTLLFGSDTTLSEEQMVGRKNIMKEPRFGVKYDIMKFIDTEQYKSDIKMREDIKYKKGVTYEGLGKYIGVVTVYPWGVNYKYTEHQFTEGIIDNIKVAKINKIFIEKLPK